MVFPTGRYSPGASDNVGSGYFGNHVQTGSTLYITKNKGTSANLFTDWEVHDKRPAPMAPRRLQGRPSVWGGSGRFPLKKNMTQLLQLGVVGYDQWQVTNNCGTVRGLTMDASRIPYHSVHAVGGASQLHFAY